MARRRGGVPVRWSWLAFVLWTGILGCTASDDYLEGYRPTAAYRNRDQYQRNSSRGDLVRTSYEAPVAPKAGPADSMPPAPPHEMPAPPEGPPPEGPQPQPLPTEMAMTTLPSYIIEPPDILYIDAIRIVPKPPYRIEPLDVLVIQVGETLPNHPSEPRPIRLAPTAQSTSVSPTAWCVWPA
jgi:hypothetical protein